MDDTSDTFALVGRTLVDKYEVERVVARGGFGVVYRARHVELDVPVALKVLMVPEHFDRDERVEFLGMFKREARTIAALNHDAVVRVIDYGTATVASGESPWMALEWLDGRTLEADLAARPLGAGRSPREALNLLRPALDALACAHAAGVAHRDVKPANLMLLADRRGSSRLRVLDFGISKVMDPDERAGSGQTATSAGISSYSLLYAAPEQISRSRTGPWTDVHAAALVLVEVLTGHRAYRGTDPVEIFGDIVDRERPTPKRLGVDVGPWEAVLDRALARLPSERYPDADALLAALDGSVDAADAAWRSSRGEALVAVTAPAVVATSSPASPSAPRTQSDRPAPASVVAPRPRSARLAPIVAVIVLALAVVVTRAATRPSAPARAIVPAPAPSIVPAPAPAPPLAAPAAAPPLTPPPAAPAFVPDATAASTSPAAPAAIDEPPRHRRRGRHVAAVPVVAAASASPPAPEPIAAPTPAPAPAPTPAPAPNVLME